MKLCNPVAGQLADRQFDYFIILLLFLLAIISINLRGLIPYDETRYLAVAWEMWRDNHFLIPRINGEIYADKPPLLFWLINVNWFFIGPNEWFPRAIPFIFSTINIFLTRYIALKLWPEYPQLKQFVPLVLLAMPLWFLYSTPLMFDMFQTFLILIAIIGLFNFNYTFRGPILYGTAIGLGFLLKGPVILLYVLPLAITLPAWNKGYTYGYGKLTVQIIASLILAFIIISIWIIPVIHAMGMEKIKSLFLHQTADRIVNASSHSRPMWWYLYFLPAILFPWFYKKNFLLSLKIKPSRISPQILFCILWLFIPFIFFSIIDAKQLHYLLPLLPALAILISYKLVINQHIESNKNNSLISIIYIFAGIIFLVYILFANKPDHKSWIIDIPLWWTFIAIFIGLILIFYKGKLTQLPVFLPGIMTIILLFSLYICVLIAPRPFTDIDNFSKILSSLQKQNIPLGNIGTNREQFEFPGRLKIPLDKVNTRDIKNWAEQHPNGFLIAKIKESEYNKNKINVFYLQPYRFKHMLILISSEDILKNKYSL